MRAVCLQRCQRDHIHALLRFTTSKLGSYSNTTLTHLHRVKNCLRKGLIYFVLKKIKKIKQCVSDRALFSVFKNVFCVEATYWPVRTINNARISTSIWKRWFYWRYLILSCILHTTIISINTSLNVSIELQRRAVISWSITKKNSHFYLIPNKSHSLQ